MADTITIHLTVPSAVLLETRLMMLAELLGEEPDVALEIIAERQLVRWLDNNERRAKPIATETQPAGEARPEEGAPVTSRAVTVPDASPAGDSTAKKRGRKPKAAVAAAVDALKPSTLRDFDHPAVDPGEVVVHVNRSEAPLEIRERLVALGLEWTGPGIAEASNAHLKDLADDFDPAGSATAKQRREAEEALRLIGWRCRDTTTAGLKFSA